MATAQLLTLVLVTQGGLAVHALIVSYYPVHCIMVV